MLNRYKIRLIKKYDFELDDKTEEGVREQVNYIMNQTQLLEKPYVRKNVKIKIKKVHRKEVTNEKNS